MNRPTVPHCTAFQNYINVSDFSTGEAIKKNFPELEKTFPDARFLHITSDDDEILITQVLHADESYNLFVIDHEESALFLAAEPSLIEGLACTAAYLKRKGPDRFTSSQAESLKRMTALALILHRSQGGEIELNFKS